MFMPFSTEQTIKLASLLSDAIQILPEKKDEEEEEDDEAAKTTKDSEESVTQQDKANSAQPN